MCACVSVGGCVGVCVQAPTHPCMQEWMFLVNSGGEMGRHLRQGSCKKKITVAEMLQNVDGAFLLEVLVL